MNDVFVSPQFRANDLVGASFDRKIEVFADQTKGWLIDQAKVLSSNQSALGQHAGYAVLALCIVYVESIACFMRGESSDNNARDFFDFGLVSVFPDLPRDELELFSKDFYREVRCGLLHQGLPRGKIGITRGAHAALAIVTSGASLRNAIIDPWLFLAHVENHFTGYVQRLKDPFEIQLRTAFEKWFESRAV